MTVDPEDETEGSGDFDLRSPPPDLLGNSIPSFDILHVIGRGGMGTVYKARQPVLDRVVALKVLPFPEVEDAQFENFKERFRREATAMARLRHDNIVSLYSFGETDEGQLFFVMEFVEGQDLSHRIASSDVPLNQVAGWFEQVCEALQYAHEKGIIHRDIKPANILIDAYDTAKVADFGLAKFSLSGGSAAESQLTQTNVVVGTPHFVAPELIENPQDVDARADIYAIGVTLYIVLTGKLPRGIPTMPSQLVDGLSPGWDVIVEKCLANDRSKRYSTARELQEDLRAVRETSIPLVASASGTVRPPRPHSDSKRRMSPKKAPRKSRRWLNLILASAGVAAIVVVAFLLRDRPGDGEKERSLADEGRTSPVDVSELAAPLDLEPPARPQTAGVLAGWPIGGGGNSAMESFEILEGSGDIVMHCDVGEGEHNVILGLKRDGSVALYNLVGELEANWSPDLSDVVWIHGGTDFFVALCADGSAYRIDPSVENRTTAATRVADSMAMIAVLGDGMVGLSRRGHLLHDLGDSADEWRVLEDAGACESLGVTGTCLVALGKDGYLRVWDLKGKVPQRRSPASGVDSRLGLASISPGSSDRWIPTTESWAILPGGSLISLGAVGGLEGLPVGGVDGVADVSGRVGLSAYRQDGVWRFPGAWKDDELDTLIKNAEGARELSIRDGFATALFMPGVDLAARVLPDPPVMPADAHLSNAVDFDGRTYFSWLGARTEIQTLEADWDEQELSRTLVSLDKRCSELDAILTAWGCGPVPGKLVWREAADLAGDSVSAEGGWRDGVFPVSSTDLAMFVSASPEVSAFPSDEALPPAGVLSPVVTRLSSPGDTGGFFGVVEVHLRAFATRLAVERAIGGTESRVLLASFFKQDTSISRDDPAMLFSAPGVGTEYFSALLFQLMKDYGGGAYLDELIGRQLAQRDPPGNAEEEISNFVVSACQAANSNLLPLFEDLLHWPLSKDAKSEIERSLGIEPTVVPPAGGLPEPPNEYFRTWTTEYESRYRLQVDEHRKRIAVLQDGYRAALERRIAQFEAAGNEAAAGIFAREVPKVGPGYEGPPQLRVGAGDQLDRATQQALQDLDRTLGRDYRKALIGHVSEFSHLAGGRWSRALDLLFDNQIELAIEGDDTASQWAFDRLKFERDTTFIHLTRAPEMSLNLSVEYEELIGWAVREGAAVDLKQALTPTDVREYRVTSADEVKSGRFIWQKLKIVGIHRGAQAKRWSDIDLAVIALLDDLEQLDCGCGEVETVTIEGLAGLEKLEKLALRGVRFSGDGRRAIAALGRLELDSLNVSGADLPPQALEVLASSAVASKLETLSIANTGVTDILPLSDCRVLKSLDITGCDVPAENIELFRKAKRNCVVVQ